MAGTGAGVHGAAATECRMWGRGQRDTGWLGPRQRLLHCPLMSVFPSAQWLVPGRDLAVGCADPAQLQCQLLACHARRLRAAGRRRLVSAGTAEGRGGEGAQPWHLRDPVFLRTGLCRVAGLTLGKPWGALQPRTGSRTACHRAVPVPRPAATTQARCPWVPSAAWPVPAQPVPAPSAPSRSTTSSSSSRRPRGPLRMPRR